MENTEHIQTRAGYIAVIGKPNVGKSTLMNAIIGAKLSIVTPKPQTTRKKVLGIYTSDTSQLVFLDTPGILKPRYELHRSMMKTVHESLESADAIALITDASNPASIHHFLNEEFLEFLTNTKLPIVLVLNKLDLLDDKKSLLPLIDEVSKKGIFKEIAPVSALKELHIKDLISIFEKLIPFGEFYYDPELLSTQNERYFVSEIIREHVFTMFKEEVPYSTEVNIVEFKERDNGKWFISAEIIVERSTQKRIIIGQKGERLRQLGSDARYAIEHHLEQAVFLELFVKVRDNWRNDKTMLRQYGY